MCCVMEDSYQVLYAETDGISKGNISYAPANFNSYNET